MDFFRYLPKGKKKFLQNEKNKRKALILGMNTKAFHLIFSLRFFAEKGLPIV
jgi:hypothetical protein